MRLDRLAALGAAALCGVLGASAVRADDAVKRGEYLVHIIGCGDCHTPGVFLGKPDFARALSGGDVGFELPGVGIHWPSNLTSDKETGLGTWTEPQIIAAFTKGITPDGEHLLPMMPYPNFAQMTAEDQHAVAVYLMSLPPIHNAIPGPTKPGEKPAGLYFHITAPQ